MVACWLVLDAGRLDVFFSPMSWYQTTPGVVDTGPFNMHFVMDIGLVFLMSAGGHGIWFALSKSDRNCVRISVAGASCRFSYIHLVSTRYAV